MALALGPMPERLREVVRRWIEEGRRTEPRRTKEVINALFITGGPGGCAYLDADGEVWNWYDGDESPMRMEDGPRKVGVIVIATECFPELTEWLPQRPVEAVDCPTCAASGSLLPPLPPLQCPECHGLGWRVPS